MPKQKGPALYKSIQASESFEQSRKLPIHLLLNVTEEMDVMRDEIFGPLLPVIPYSTLKMHSRM